MKISPADILFHATTKEKVESIQQYGLGGNPTAEKNFDCENGVYLAENPHLALGFLLERALTGPFLEKSPKDYVESFVIFEIPKTHIEENRLAPDPNINVTGFWIYRGIIPAATLKFQTLDELPKP